MTIHNREEHFWSKVDKKEDHECWEWKGTKNKDGYGAFHSKSKSPGAHRYAWELHYGCKVPEGMQILHHCDNPGCVNHNHLYCGTVRDNIQDCATRNRAERKKAASSRAKLYNEDVEGIKKLYALGGIKQSEIALLLNVSQKTISNHLRGEIKTTKGSRRSL